MGKILRVICILEGEKPIKYDSGQIIFPSMQLNRKNDVFVLILDNNVDICQEGQWIAIISTVAETETPIHEVKEVFNTIIKGDTNVISMIDQTSDQYEPINADNQFNNLFVTSSLDEMSHFDKGMKEVISIYEKIIGEKQDLNVFKQELEKARIIQQSGQFQENE